MFILSIELNDNQFCFIYKIKTLSVLKEWNSLFPKWITLTEIEQLFHFNFSLLSLSEVPSKGVCKSKRLVFIVCCKNMVSSFICRKIYGIGI